MEDHHEESEDCWDQSETIAQDTDTGLTREDIKEIALLLFTDAI